MLQVGNGCIGDKAIGAIAALVMIWWARRLQMKLQRGNIINDLLKIFVDNVNGTFKTVPEGTEYVDGELKFNAEKAIKDKDVPCAN